jgi:hypothetical protein
MAMATTYAPLTDAEHSAQLRNTRRLLGNLFEFEDLERPQGHRRTCAGLGGAAGEFGGEFAALQKQITGRKQGEATLWKQWPSLRLSG